MPVDPSVSITNGVPTSGSGAITTLGLTIPPAASTTSGVQGGPMCQGAVTTSAPTYTTGQIDPLSLDTSGNLRITGAVTASQTGTWVSNITQFGGTNISTGTGASGTGIPRVTVSNDSNILATQSGTWNIGSITTLPALPTNQSVNISQVNGVTPLMGNGVTGTGSQRVTIASDNTAFTVNAAQSGTWNVGTLTSITNTVNVASPTAPVSTMNSASATGGIASAMSAVFDDVTPTAITENNFGYVRMSANRNQYATIRDAAGNERGVNVSTGNALLVDASATTQPISGTVTVTQGTAANLNATVTGTVTANQGGSNWSINNAQVNGVALTTGTGASTTGTQRVAVSTDSNILVTQSGTWTVQQGTPPWTVGGDVASGSADSGNPVKIGGIAAGLTANPTPVTVGQRVNAYVDKVGRQIVAGSPRALKVNTYTTLTTTTETTIIGATVSAFNDLYSLVITNSSATSTFVDIRNTTGGSVVMTIAAPAGDTRGFTVPVDSAMNQATANTNWTAQLRTAVSSVNITAMAATTV